MQGYINRRTADALNAIGRVLMNAGNNGMPRAAIARELGKSRPSLSNLVTSASGEGPNYCFNYNVYGEPVVNVQCWDNTKQEFTIEALRYRAATLKGDR